jgi:hypothetical protein
VASSGFFARHIMESGKWARNNSVELSTNHYSRAI